MHESQQPMGSGAPTDTHCNSKINPYNQTISTNTIQSNTFVGPTTDKKGGATVNNLFSYC